MITVSRPVACLTATTVIICAVSASALEHTQDSVATIQRNIKEGKAVLVDVREQDEWDAGHLADAVHVPLSELKNLSRADVIKKLGDGQIIYTYCKAGRRALAAGELLDKMKLEARPIKLGYEELKKAWK